jgi:hypothetical protein
MSVTSQDYGREECWPGVHLGQFWPRVATAIDRQVAWYLTLYLGSTAAHLLVDSGAQVTMISKEIYDSLAPSYRPPLTSCKHPINAANGGQITTYGQATFSISIAKHSFSVEIVVADMGGLPGVLGMDFLSQNDAVLHCRTGKMEIGNRVIKCNGRHPEEGGQVALTEAVKLPPGHVCFVTVTITRWGGSQRLYDVIEPISEVCNQDGILMPRGVIKRSCNSCTLQLTNIGGNERVLPGGLLLAYLDPVDSVHSRPKYAEPMTVASAGVERALQLPDHLKPLVDSAVDLNEAQQNSVSNLLMDFQHCFEGGDYGLGKTTLVKHKIETGDHAPIKIPPRRLGWAQRRALNEEVDKMLEKGVIEPSDSPWSSPPVLVKKKDGTFRFCVDYRKINSISRRDAFPLPRIDDCLDCLAGSKWFCTLDLSAGYWQIAMEDQDRPKTAFSTPRGHYQFKVLPFGVCNGPATLERLMELVLRGLSNEDCLCYMDDVVLSGSTFEQTMTTLKDVLNRLSAAGLRLKPSKCELFRTEVAFLGHLVGREGVRPDPRKIEVISNWPVPVNLSELRSFLGFASYYRKYIPNFSHKATSLNSLTQKGVPYVWTAQCQGAFETLRNALISAPILALPREGCQVILDTDASDTSIGGVLSQIIDGQEKVIAYASKTLSTSQRRYCTTFKELLAVVKMAKIFRPYLYGQPHVIVRTDHKALVWLQRFRNAEGMLARWLASLSEYDLVIEHRPGKMHGNADALSRMPIRSCPRTDCPDPGHTDKIISAEIKEWNVRNGFSKTECKKEAELETSFTAAACHRPPQSPRSHHFDPPVENNPLLDHHVCASHQQRHSNWLSTLSDTQVKDAQHEDTDLKKVIEWVKAEERPSFRDISLAGSQLKNLWAQFNCLKLSNGKLTRSCKLPCGEQVTQLVVPPALRREIFEFLHTSHLGGHMGISKTIAKLRRRFYWPGYREDVIRWCQWCDKCQKRNPSTQKKASLQQKPVGMPMERIAVDILGPLVETERGMKYIMVVVDYFSKWTEAYALPDQKSMTVAEALVTNFVLRFGCPLQLHCDQGPNWESHLFKDVCTLLGICKTRTTPYRPESDGMVERFNRSVQNMLAKLVDEDRANWDEILPYVMCAYRATPHESTGISPNMMMLGRESDLPVDLVFGYEVPDEVPCPNEYVEWVRDALRTSHERARRELGRAAERQARHYNRLSGDPLYEVGDWVLLFYPPIANKKLGLKFLGPYQVTRKITEVSYEIKAQVTGKKKVVHVNHLKPYMAEVRPDDLERLPDLPTNLDLDGLLGDQEIQDPPVGDLINFDSDPEDQDPDSDGPNLTDLSQGLQPALNPAAAPFVPRRARNPPQRFGHNVGYL